MHVDTALGRRSMPSLCLCPLTISLVSWCVTAVSECVLPKRSWGHWSLGATEPSPYKHRFVVPHCAWE